MFVCLYVCMSVRNGFTIEIYGLMLSLRTLYFLARAAQDAIERWWHGDRGRGLGGQSQNGVQMYGRR